MEQMASTNINYMSWEALCEESILNLRPKEQKALAVTYNILSTNKSKKE